MRRLNPGWVAVAALLTVMVMIIGWLTTIADYGTAVKHMPRRRAEATEAIRSVHEIYAQTGEWPTESSAIPSGVPEGWSYEYYSPEDPPALALFGPYHLVLRYCFARSGENEEDGEWRFRSEGTPIPLDSNADGTP